MRFLILTQYFTPEVGAPQVRLAAMIRVLRKLGHDVEVVTALPNYPVGRIYPEYRRRLYVREELDGVPVHRVWLYACTGAGPKRLLNYLSFTCAALAGIARSQKPDYLFVESPPLFTGLTARLASIVWQVPFIFNVADLWPDSVLEMGLMREGLALQTVKRLERWIYRKATYVTAVTDGIRKSLIQEKGVPADKVLFLPNGVDPDLFKPRPPDLKLARELGLEGKRVLLYAGTLGLAQGLEIALLAMESLRAPLPDLELVFVGGGSERDRLVRQAEERGLTNVRFLPPCPPEQVARLCSLAWAGFSSLKNLPLFEGARPSKLLPIMASGKPVIYSGAGEGARLIASVQAGQVAPPENAEALAQIIRSLTEHPELAAEMGRNGQCYVKNNLTWLSLVGDWLAQLARSESLGISAKVSSLAPPG